MYDKLLDRLYSASFNGIKLGLDKLSLLDSLLLFPSKKFKSIHIAGSNGKGSVATKIATSLTLSGNKVGLFTSPHISSFRERIRIDGDKVSKKCIENGLSKIFSILEKNRIEATFFEINTILAFYIFAEEKVAVSIIETGLGGRLDATNIILPILSIITSISLDHTDILGDTLEEIAYEKAGIIKKEVPVIVGPSADLPEIRKRAGELNSPYFVTKRLDGWYDKENTEIAKKALEYLKIGNLFKIDERSISEGIEKRPPCRFEVFYSKTGKRSAKAIIFDVAHNEKGFQRLFEAINYHFKDCSVRTILGVSKGKDIKKCSEIISKNSKAIHLVSNSHARLYSRDELQQYFSKDKIYPEEDLKTSVRSAIKNASINDELLLVAGSFFIMDDIKKIII